MKGIKFILVVIISGICMASCEKETSTQNGVLPINDTAACKSCIYQPWCDGSVFVYVDSTNDGNNVTVSNKTETLHILGDTLINGVLYSKSTNGQNDIFYHNCTNGVTTLIEYVNTGSSGSALVPIKYTLLKSNEPVGAVWNDVNPGNGIDNLYEYKIIAKSANRTVLGIIYSDVIQVHQKISINDSVLGVVIFSESDLYFAKGIGLIDKNIIDGTVNQNVYHRVLQSYILP